MYRYWNFKRHFTLPSNFYKILIRLIVFYALRINLAARLYRKFVEPSFRRTHTTQIICLLCCWKEKQKKRTDENLWKLIVIKRAERAFKNEYKNHKKVYSHRVRTEFELKQNRNAFIIHATKDRIFDQNERYNEPTKQKYPMRAQQRLKYGIILFIWNLFTHIYSFVRSIVASSSSLHWQQCNARETLTENCSRRSLMLIYFAEHQQLNNNVNYLFGIFMLDSERAHFFARAFCVCFERSFQ